MRELIGTIVDSLEGSEAVALCRVIGRRGSLPMGRRAMMLVLSDGRCLGTVGGGCLEADVYAHGRELISRGGSRVDEYSLNEVEAGLQGHVCGGTVTIMSEAVTPEPDTRLLFSRLRKLIETRVPAALATRLPAADSTTATHARILCSAAGDQISDPAAGAGAAILQRCAAALQGPLAEVVETTPEARYWVEPISPQPSVAVFGAGHCGRAIGRLAADAGFRVVLLDDRESFLEPEATPWADERRCVDFAMPLDLELGPDDYYVIVTRGHDHDIHVLRALLPRAAAYLGMIGSRRKRLLFERVLAKEGHDRESLDRLRSPMGLEIGADTPEEIAVAVVAEMIAVRRGARRSGARAAAHEAASARSASG